MDDSIYLNGASRRFRLKTRREISVAVGAVAAALGLSDAVRKYSSRSRLLYPPANCQLIVFNETDLSGVIFSFF